MAATTPRIPTMSGIPILGNLPDLRADRLGFLERVARECGDIGIFSAMGREFVLLNSPVLAHDILVTQAAKVEKGKNLRENGSPIFGNGLVTSLNAFHKRQRTLIAPVFQHGRIADYATIMTTYADDLQRSWHHGKTRNIADDMMRLTLRVIGKVLFDQDIGGDAPEVGAALDTVRDTFMRVTNMPVRLPDWFPNSPQRHSRDAVAQLNAIIYRIINERRAEGTTDHGDFLSMLLRAHDEDGIFMSDQQIRDEAMTLFLAGHETTANGLAWAWYLLTQHPAVYARMQDEGDCVLVGRMPTAADLAQLPYTLQVFKEAMRLYPPVPIVVRQASVPVVIAGQPFPVGTRFIVSPWTLHRRADLFPDPTRFDPDRFAPEHEKDIPKHAYLPFVTGPRNCIGASFALFEGQMILAALAQRVIFALIPGQTITPEASITLRPREGVRVAISRRL